MIVDEIKRCRNVGAPLLAIETADQMALIDAVRTGFKAEVPRANISPRWACRITSSHLNRRAP